MYPLYRPELWIGYLISKGVKWNIYGAVVLCLVVQYYRTTFPVIADEIIVSIANQ